VIQDFALLPSIARYYCHLNFRLYPEVLRSITADFIVESTSPFSSSFWEIWSPTIPLLLFVSGSIWRQIVKVIHPCHVSQMNLDGIKYQAMGPCLVMIGSQKYHLQYEVLNPSLSFCSCYGTGCAFVLYVLYNTIFLDSYITSIYFKPSHLSDVSLVV
jgi:hypothetical protein